MAEPELVDVTTIARGFPSVPEPEIDRAHLLDTMDGIFRGSKVDVLLIDGDEGVGKTVLLSQIAKRHYRNSLSLFLRPASRAATDPAYVAELLAEQLHWILYKEILQKSVSESDLRGYFAALDRRFHRERKVCFVIVDGLQDNAFPPQFVTSILNDLLPFGMSSYRYMITGTLDGLGKRLHPTLSVRPYNAALCSSDDARRYLGDLKLDAGTVSELYRLCNKNFGRLATVRRLIQSGASPESLLEAETPPDFLELEWQGLTSDPSSPIIDILRVIAFAQTSYDRNALSTITDHPLEVIDNVLCGVNCLETDKLTGDVSFCSEVHRRYAQSQCADFRDLVLTQLILYHTVESAGNKGAASPLPRYLGEAGRHGELLSLLDTPYFVAVTENTHSLTALQNATRMGLDSSVAIDDQGAIARFSAQSAFLHGISTGQSSQAEIQARVQFGDKDLAIGLAERASLTVDRLALLVTTAAALKKYFGERDESVIEHIRALIEQINLKEIGERAIEIASELVTVDPGLAFEIVQRSTDNSEGSASVDASIASLAFHTITASHRDLEAAIATTEQASRTTSDPATQELLRSISLFLETTSADDVIRHAGSLEPSRAIFFLRKWATVTKAFDEAATVLDFALDLLIRSTDYSPTIKDLRELATVLPSLTSDKDTERLVIRFDSLRTTVMDLGTNEELTRLQLFLAIGEVRLNATKGHRRLLDLYWEVSGIGDPSVRATCLSWMVSFYRDIDFDGSLEQQEGLLTVLRQDLKRLLDELLQTSADHFRVAEGALQALAKRDLDQAIELAGSLNTLDRRDSAHLTIIKQACSPTLDDSDLVHFYSTIDSISADKKRDEAISVLVRGFCKSQGGSNTDFQSHAATLAEYCKRISKSSVRAKCLTDIYACALQNSPPTDTAFQESILRDIDASWMSVDELWRKATSAFQIAGKLVEEDSTTARKYMDRGESIREQGGIFSINQFYNYECLVRLTIRAFAGVLASNSEDPSMLRLLIRVIDIIPSNQDRVILWSELASRAFIVDRHDYCKLIADQHIRPLLVLFSDDNKAAKFRAEVAAAPALYVAHPGTAIERISKLPQRVTEDAADGILRLLIYRIPDREPTKVHRTNLQLGYEQISDILSILNHVKTDSMLGYYVGVLAKIATSKSGRRALTKQQRAGIASRIETEIVPQLPDEQNIRHDGYAIVCLAHVGTLEMWPLNRWEELLSRTKALPNLADRAFVTVSIAGAMPARLKARAEEELRAAKELIDTTAVQIDRIDGLENLAQTAVDIGSPLAKGCIKSAYAFACSGSGGDLSSRRRRLVDLAHSIDPDFAVSLTSVIDDDPLRSALRLENKEHLRILELEKMISTNSDSKVDELQKERGELTQAAWRSLGLLNASLVAPVHGERLRPYVILSAELPLGELAYPILAWAIENQIRRTARAPAGRSSFPRLFDALWRASESAVAIIEKTSGASRVIPHRFGTAAGGESKTSIVVDVGDRDRALRFLSTWIDNEVGEYLKICDPYFTTDDLEIINLIRTVNSTARIIVLTSTAAQRTKSDLQQVYTEAWRLNYSPHLPGNCDIIVVGTVDRGEFPIHDRWWITEGSGLRVGTSFNSLGRSKASEISVLDYEEFTSLEQEIDAVLHRNKREHKGQLLSFYVVAL